MKSRHVPLFRGTLVKAACLSLLCAFAGTTRSQQAQSQSSAPVLTIDSQARRQQIADTLSNPALMTQLYGFFFSYQHHLDAVADQQEAAGKDASGLRRVLQGRLGFSDDDYKPIRESCDRVASQTKVLHDQVRSNPRAIANFAQARDQEISAEMAILANELSARNKMAFETFLVRTFAPRQDTRKAVQQ